MMRRWLSLIALATTAALMTGCLGYRVGAVGERRYSSIAVPMFRNKTVTPQLEAQVTNGIIKRLHEDGTLLVQNRSTADAVLFGTITRYNRRSVRGALTDAGVPREYRLTITVVVEVLDQRTGEHILKPTTLQGSAEAFIGTDLQSADDQALPLIAEDIARQVAGRLTENW
jgi:outer membrane lipopolysaccharide assembly protein LptE/RlpB